MENNSYNMKSLEPLSRGSSMAQEASGHQKFSQIVMYTAGSLGYSGTQLVVQVT